MWRPHLVHPCATVGRVAAENEPSCGIDSHFIVEPFRSHVLIDLCPSTPLPKRQALKKKIYLGAGTSCPKHIMQPTAYDDNIVIHHHRDRWFTHPIMLHQSFMYNFLQGLFHCSLLVTRLFLAITWEKPNYRFTQNGVSFRYSLSINLDTVEPPPDCISAIETGLPSAVQQIRN